MKSTTFAAIAALFVSSALAAPTPESLRKLQRAPGAKKADSYIVKLKENASRDASVSALNDLVFAFDDVESFKEVTYADWTVVNGYAAILKGAALDFVLADPNVEYVEENGIVTIADYENVELREASPEAEANGEKWADLVKRAGGAGTNFYGVDTGIRTTHTSFGGRASWLSVHGGYAAADGNGHGTHTAGSAAGSGHGPASQALIFAVKVLSDSGSGTNADVVSGINSAVNHAVSSGKPSVVNLSLGGGVSTTTDAAVSNGISRGVHFTIAAGNSNVDAANTSPARVAAAITVAAISSSNVKASFSNFGSVIDVSFLGVSVTSAWSTSNTATNTISGTSMAAPGVAGLVLVHLGNNGQKTPAALITALKAGASSIATGFNTATTKLVARAF